MRKMRLLIGGLAVLQMAMIGCAQTAAPGRAEKPVDTTAEQVTRASEHTSNDWSQAAGISPSQDDWYAQVDVAPATAPEAFWAKDNPQQIAPLGFGKLPPEHPVYVTRPAIGRYELAASLPDAPNELPVYVVGSYPAGYGEPFDAMIMREIQGCAFVWQYSLAQCGPTDTPTGAKAPINSRSDAEIRAKTILGQVWLPDFHTERVDHRDDGTWRVMFKQMVGETPLYTDKPLQVEFNAAGQTTFLQGRRRPLMAQATYPLRSPADAWEHLKRGDGFPLNIMQPEDFPKQLAHFAVTEIALAYVVTHANAPKEIMQPYYLFRNEQRQTLYVPAVTDEYVTWPKPQ